MTAPLPNPSPAGGRGALRFAGYAAVFGRVDQGGDVVRAGAFARSLKRGESVPLLWEHGGGPIGRVDYLKEDGRGLRVIGRVADARAAALLRAGTARGLSFGYRVRRAAGAAPRALMELDLVEISLVRLPMQQAALVHALEGGTAGDQMPSHSRPPGRESALK